MTTADAAGGLRSHLPSWRRAVEILVVAILLAALTPFVLYAVPALAGADASYVVLSGSMEPTIAAGDVVLVESVDPSAVEEGDVITYRHPGAERPTTHRVVGVTETERGPVFRTKGDGNEDPDPRPVTGEDLVGRVVLTIPLVGHVVGFAGTPLGVMTLVVVPFGLLALTEVASVLGHPWRRRGESDGTASGEASSAGRIHAGAPADGRANAPASDGAVVVTATDLRLSVVALAALSGYAGWITYRFWTVTGVPDPVSAAVCVGAATGVALLLVVRRFVPTAADAEAVTAETGRPDAGAAVTPALDSHPPAVATSAGSSRPSAAARADGSDGPTLAVLSPPSTPDDDATGPPADAPDAPAPVADGSGVADDGSADGGGDR